MLLAGTQCPTAAHYHHVTPLQTHLSYHGCCRLHPSGGKGGEGGEGGRRGGERERGEGGEVPMTDKEVMDDVKGFQMRS